MWASRTVALSRLLGCESMRRSAALKTSGRRGEVFHKRACRLALIGPEWSSGFPISMSENGEPLTAAPLNLGHGSRSGILLPGVGCSRRAVRRRVLRRREDDGHLLPADLHGAHAAAGKLPLLSQRRGGGTRGVSALLALPARIVDRSGARRCGRPTCLCRGGQDRGGGAQRGTVARNAGGRVSAWLAPSATRGAKGTGRVACRV